MSEKQDKEKVGKFEEGFASLLGRHTDFLIGLGAFIVIVVVALWIGISVSNKNADKNQAAIDALSDDFYGWYNSPSDEALPEHLVDELTTLSHKKTSSYPAMKAEYLLGLIALKQDTFDDALDHFTTVAFNKRRAESHLQSLALFNAAVSAEQLGDSALAMEYYQGVYDTYEDAPQRSNALFNLARLHESNGQVDLAKALLQQLIDEFEQSEFAKLAQSRLVILH